jgi:ATP-dependent DNA helicase RecG
MTWIILPDREGHWNPAGLSLKSPRFLSNRWGPPHFLDLKRIEIAPAKLSESISAFANSSGGELFVGIAEETESGARSWRGFPTQEAANGLFQVISRMTPLANHYDATWIAADGLPGFVLHLLIPKTRDIVVASDGHPYKRHNAQNLRVVGEGDIQRLRLDKGILTFEDDVVNTPLPTITNSETGSVSFWRSSPAQSRRSGCESSSWS